MGKNQMNNLRLFLRFRLKRFRNQPAEWQSPKAVTFTRLFAKLSLADLQNAFAEFVSAKEFQAYILGHWEVENCLHLAKDKEYGEDKHVLRSGWDEAWTVLTNMAVSLVRLLREGERTLRAVRERCNTNPLSAATKLGWKT
jgi:hypothetical protein